MKNKKYLIVVDLDGTLLNNDLAPTVSQENIQAIKRAQQEGHIVCIATGRPWKASKDAYSKCQLNTIVANYNGAQIHNPKDYDFNQIISYMNLNDVMYVLGDKQLQNAISNTAIEGPGWVMLAKRDKNFEKIFGLNAGGRLKVGLNFHKLPLKPTGVILDTKKGIDILKLKDHLQRTYGDLVEFSSWSKGEGLTPAVDMTNVGVTKAKALSLMARYYKIPMKNTIAIGDGYNDVPMFEVAEFSIAMKQATKDIQAKATYTTQKTNAENGVAHFIHKFLNDNGDFKSEMRKCRKKIRATNYYK